MILKLKPAFKDYIWGGTKLRDDFGFKSDLKKIAEGWMLSCHKDGENIIDGGKFDGKTLSEVIKETGKDILGTKAQKYDFFPILIKLIDAKDNLSVQVHPNDDYALRVEGEYGKTECWYVIDCDEGAELIYGFKKKISNEEFRKRIAVGYGEIAFVYGNVFDREQFARSKVFFVIAIFLNNRWHYTVIFRWFAFCNVNG